MNQSDPFQITISHLGGFVAEVKISYIDSGSMREIDINNMTAPFSKVVLLPFESTDIQIQLTVFTGLVWEPKRVIKEIKFAEARSVTITISGTVLDPHCHVA